MLRVNKLFGFLFLMLVALMTMPKVAFGEGDLAIRAQKITIKLGSKKSDYHLAPKQIEMVTGKAYRLEIISGGFKEYELEAEEFFRNCWIRKVEVEGVELDVSTINSIEFEANYEQTEVEITLVPIRSGVYDFAIEGLEQKGMEGEFIVK